MSYYNSIIIKANYTSPHTAYFFQIFSVLNSVTRHIITKICARKLGSFLFTVHNKNDQIFKKS